MIKMNKSKLIYNVIVIFIMLLSITTIVNAAEPLAGSGTEKKPYIINIDNAQIDPQNNNKYIEIPSDGKNFYFKIEGNNSSGTYCVEYDETTEIAKFIFIDGSKRVVYNRGSGAYYMQAGTVPDTTTSVPVEVEELPFIIKAKEECKGDNSTFYTFAVVGGKGTSRRNFDLNNAPLPGGDPNVPHPSYFVFAKGGTVEELYKSVSDANCNGTIYAGANNVRARKIPSGFMNWGRTNIMELILDPRAPRPGEPSTIVRYANWDGTETNPTVKNKNKFTVEITYQFFLQEEEKAEKGNVIEIAVTWILIRNW